MNEFKVGDIAVFVDSDSTNNLIIVEKVSPKKGYPQRIKAGRFGNIPTNRYRIRHATLEEIKAGRRL